MIILKYIFTSLVTHILNCGIHVFRSAPFEFCPFALSAGLNGLVALRQIGGGRREEKEARLRWKLPEKLRSCNRRRKRGDWSRRNENQVALLPVETKGGRSKLSFFCDRQIKDETLSGQRSRVPRFSFSLEHFVFTFFKWKERLILML